LILGSATLPPSLLAALNTEPVLRSRDMPHLLAPGLHRLPPGLKTRFVNQTGGNLAATVVKEVRMAFLEDALEDRAEAHGEDKRLAKMPKSRAVVFCNTDMRAREVARQFREKEPELGVLEWTSSGEGRTRGTQGGLEPFLKNPKRALSPDGTNARPHSTDPSPRILITTSLLSRGLDFDEEVRTVALVDPPKDTLDFVHRAGRTGRAGRRGRVIVFGMGDGVGGSRGVQGRGGVGRGMAGVLRSGGRRG
jgi:ATP-dependent RNA helicase MRH4